MKNYKSGLPFHLLCKAIILLLLFGLMYRCGSALYMPTAADQERTGILLDSLSEGRKLYVDHCGKLPQSILAGTVQCPGMGKKCR